VTAPEVAFFDRVRAAFDSACGPVPPPGFHYVVAGEAVTLSFARPSLAACLTPALAHLRRPDLAGGAAGLRICLWDAASTGVAPPPPPWSAHDYAGNGGIRGYTEGRVLAAFDHWLGALSLYDTERRLGLFWIRDARTAPVTLVGTPLRVMLQWWATHTGGQLIHAAAVGTPQGAVLIAGPSGAGKSTTALAAVSNGFQYIGDDFVLVKPAPRPTVHSLYNSAKLDDRTLAERFPALRAAAHPRPRRPGEKHIVFLNDVWPDRLAVTRPLAAMLLPAVTGESATRLVPMREADVLRALLPGIFPFPGSRQRALDCLSRLARSLPAYALQLGTDSSGVMSVVEPFLCAPQGVAS
jgi:hypothetical protein